MKNDIYPEKKENELYCDVAKRFAKNSTKEQFAQKILKIIESEMSDFEVISDISNLCKNI